MPLPASGSHLVTVETASKMDIEQAKMTLLLVTETTQVIDVHRCKQTLILIFMVSSPSQTLNNEYGHS